MHIDVFKNYLTLICGAVGCNMFRNLYVIENGVGRDITEDGELSCAYTVSSILRIMGWIGRPHATVTGTMRDMTDSGWRETLTLEPGVVVLWPSRGDMPEHVGFYLGNDEYMSNDSREHTPQIHGRHMRDGREPVAYYIRDFTS